MKYWKIAETKEGFAYIILKEIAVIYCEAPKDIPLREAVGENKLLKLTTIKFIDLDTVLCDDSSNMLSLDYTQRGKKDFDVDIESNAYAEIKSYLVQNFKGVTISEYSFIKQSSWNIGGLIAALIITYIEYTEAKNIQLNGIIEPKIRRSIFEEMSFQIANFLTPIGCLLVGGAVIAFFGYLIGKAFIKPKQGKLFTLKRNPKIIIN